MNYLRAFRRFAAAALAAAIVSLSPGLGAYARAGAVLRAPAKAGAALPVSIVGTRSRSALGRTPVWAPSTLRASRTLGLSAPTDTSARAAAGAASSVSPAPGAVPPRALPVPAAVIGRAPVEDVSAPVAPSVASAMGGLLLPLPRTSAMGAEASGAAMERDFQLRLGTRVETRSESAFPVSAGASFGSFSGHALLRASSKSSKGKGARNMPEEGAPKGSETDLSDLDELGNPRRQVSPGGPDAVEDGTEQRPSSPLFGIGALAPLALVFGVFWYWRDISSFLKQRRLEKPAAVLLAAGTVAAALHAGMALGAAAATIAALIPAFILHEMGHAWMASRLGDQTARLQRRLSFKPRDLLTHVHPFGTLLLPLVSTVWGLLLLGVPMTIGYARPVPFNPANFKDPVKGRALTALAGPAVNFLLAGAFAAAYQIMEPAGLARVLLSGMVQWNLLLGIFNLLPISFFGLDGHHVAESLLYKPALKSGDYFNTMKRWMTLISLGGLFLLASGAVWAAVQLLCGFLLGA